MLLLLGKKDISLGQGKAAPGLSKETRVKLPSKIQKAISVSVSETEQAAQISVLFKTRFDVKIQTSH